MLAGVLYHISDVSWCIISDVSWCIISDVSWCIISCQMLAGVLYQMLARKQICASSYLSVITKFLKESNQEIVYEIHLI
jgi:hypothetical protein